VKRRHNVQSIKLRLSPFIIIEFRFAAWAGGALAENAVFIGVLLSIGSKITANCRAVCGLVFIL
jgi:hypothetical protein